MKYVPNLIPKKSSVTWDDEITLDDDIKKSLTIWAILSYIGSTVFTISTLGTIFYRFWEGILFLTIALILLPEVHQWIERTLAFKFTWLIKGGFVLIIALIFVPVSQYYVQQGEEIRAQEQAERSRAEEEERVRNLERERKNKERLDSLNYYTLKADQKIKDRQFRNAIVYLTAALKFSANENELIQKRADCYFTLNQVKSALSDYSTLVNSSYRNSVNYYNRALCYQKLGSKGEAISDLKQAIEFGSAEAKRLHEKLNPLKRRVLYYVTRCCDGSTSSATGRGACSHHHGVCNWNDPVYQEYRDY